MAKIFDPHYHTTQSDGEDTIMASADAAYRRGLAMLIITDHLAANANYSGPTKSYQENQTILTRFRPKPRENQYPIIIGMELFLPPKAGEGEVLIFGTELCQTIQDNLEEIRKYDLDAFRRLKEQYTCAIVQCHPLQGLQQEILPILDGCEITKAGIAVPHHLQIIKDCKKHGITSLVSSDGHTFQKQRDTPWLGNAFNVASINLKTEKDLIKVIKENLIENRVFHKEEITSRFPQG